MGGVANAAMMPAEFTRDVLIGPTSADRGFGEQLRRGVLAALVADRNPGALIDLQRQWTAQDAIWRALPSDPTYQSLYATGGPEAVQRMFGSDVQLPSNAPLAGQEGPPQVRETLPPSQIALMGMQSRMQQAELERGLDPRFYKPSQVALTPRGPTITAQPRDEALVTADDLAINQQVQSLSRGGYMIPQVNTLAPDGTLLFKMVPNPAIESAARTQGVESVREPYRQGAWQREIFGQYGELPPVPGAAPGAAIPVPPLPGAAPGAPAPPWGGTRQRQAQLELDAARQRAAIPSDTQTEQDAQTARLTGAMEKLQDSFNRAREESAFPPTGWLSGRLQSGGAKWGTGGLVAMPQSVRDLVHGVSVIKNAYVKAITGAQMSKEEARRIMQQLPVMTHSTEYFQTALDGMKQDLATIHAARVAARAAVGTNQPPPLTQEDVERIASDVWGKDWQQTPAVGASTAPSRPAAAAAAPAGTIDLGGGIRMRMR